MIQVSVLFEVLVSVVTVSLIVLGVGSLILRQLRQPIERIRCVQWTLAALALTLVLRHAALLPQLSLQVLPASSSNEQPSEESYPAVAANLEYVEPMTSAAEPTTFDNVIESSATATTTPLEGTETVGEPSAAGTTNWAALQQVWPLTQFICIGIATIGAAWFSTLLVVGRWRLARLLSECQPANDALLASWADADEAKTRDVCVYVSPSINVPLTFGLRKPVIVLPRRIAESGDVSAITYCLSHEWAHIKSRDVATWWLVHLMQPMLWFQPLFWHLRRELRTAQDQLADQFATRQSTDRTEYASLLLGFAHERIKLGNLALTMADRRSSLYRRIELLCTDQLKLASAARQRVLFATVACFTLIAVSLGALRLERATAAPVENDAEPQKKASSEDKDDKSKTTDESKDNQDAEVTGVLVPAAKIQLEGDKKDVAPQEEGAVELSYSGFVLDKETKLPIRGAKVVVRRMILKSNERRVIEESEHETNLLGKFSFKIPPEQSAAKSMYIELDIEHPDYAWKKGFGYALSMIRKNERLGEKPFFSKTELSPSEAITGRVVDTDGNPVAGTHLQAYSKASADDYQDYGSFFKTKTDEDGKFRLQMVKGGPSVFWVVPKDHAAVQVISGTKRGEWGDIKVQDGVAIKGQVVDATGEPVAGVWVNLSDQESQREIQMPVGSSMNRSAMTDAKGGFSLSPMKPGKYSIDVGDWPRELKFHEKRGQRQKLNLNDVFVAKSIDIGPEDADRPFVLQAVPHVEFHGQYFDSKGKPRSGHAIYIFGQLGGQRYNSNIAPDKTGKLFGKLPHGLTDARMMTMTNEHSALQVRLEQGGPLLSGRNHELGTLEDDVTGVEIIRYTAPIVQLKPVDESGNVIKDCKVAGVYSDGKEEKMQPVGGMATNIFFEHQKDGRFRSSQMVPNRKIKFTATAEGYTDASAELELPEGAEKEIVLVLKKAAPKNDETAKAE